MKKNVYILFAACLLVVSIIALNQAQAWEGNTHREMNDAAIGKPRFDSLFWQTLYVIGLDAVQYNPYTRNSHITAGMVRKWIMGGGATEDNGSRFMNHFHDPLMPWDQAGLRIYDIPSGESSVVWMQWEINKQSYSWRDAREYYYKALSGQTPADREYWFSKTFRALGQIMHLVEDAAVPDHTRNDWGHGTDAAFTDKMTFEKWTEVNLRSISMAAGFVPEWNQIFGQKGDSQAPVPISRLIDMNVYQPGDRPNITGVTAAGMAEYSNSNFLSRNTVFFNYDYPAFDSTKPLENGQYRQKYQDGEAIDHFVLSEPYEDEVSYILDEKCYADYAEKLVPKAVAYASLIPDYFFRGAIYVMPDVYCRDPDPSIPITAGIWVYNGTDDIMKNGELEVYHMDEYGNQSRIATYALSELAPYEDIYFDLPWRGYLRVTTVFRGTHGSEDGAVIGSDEFGNGCFN